MKPTDQDVAAIDAVALAEYRRTECPWERGAIAALNPVVMNEPEGPMTIEHDAERAAARTAKAVKLVDVLVAANATADDVEQFGPADWRNAARAAWVRMPSPVTQAVVVELMRHREAQSTPVDTDPFEGLAR